MSQTILRAGAAVLAGLVAGGMAHKLAEKGFVWFNGHRYEAQTNSLHLKLGFW